LFSEFLLPVGFRVTVALNNAAITTLYAIFYGSFVRILSTRSKTCFLNECAKLSCINPLTQRQVMFKAAATALGKKHKEAAVVFVETLGNKLIKAMGAMGTGLELKV
jgi:hypothetical protein